MKRHSAEEIATKLRHAERLMAGGQSQAQACRELGVSVMTYHRWRKLNSASELKNVHLLDMEESDSEPVGQIDVADQRRIGELRVENARLRRIVTDLLLEKVKIEEQIAMSFGRKSLRRN